MFSNVFLIFEFNLYIADDRELNKLTNILCIFFWKCGLLSYPCGLMSSWAFVL